MNKILVTGGCGFLGSNLAAHAIKSGFETYVFDNLSRQGSAENLVWLKSQGNFTFIHGDICNKNDVEISIREGSFAAIFHLAGQVAMTTSIANPYKDFEINAIGTVNVLESVRKYSPSTILLYSSTNKVYGDLEQFTYKETDTRYICEQYPDGFDENVTLCFQSPYGCSKGSADQYMLDYHRIFGLRTVVFRHSSMYGSRQFATYDQGWIGWFCNKAIEKKHNPLCCPFPINGNGKQVRDILHAEDMISLYFTALKNIDSVQGNAFNIGGTINNSLSLLELFDLLNKILNVKLEYTHLPVRESDQRVFVADITKFSLLTGWKPIVSCREGISSMIDWIMSR